jgi:hypothetical protein
MREADGVQCRQTEDCSQGEVFLTCQEAGSVGRERAKLPAKTRQ